MRILFLLNNGLGNQVQTIPLYECLKKHHEVDVEYLSQYPTDTKLDIFPCNIVPVTAYNIVMGRVHKYDYIVKPWRIEKVEGNRTVDIREYEDSISELDSEFERNMKILDYLGIEREIIKNYQTKEVEVPERYITVHNGANADPAWEGKRYPYMEQLCRKIRMETGIHIISVGSPQEAIFSTDNRTGLSQKETAYIVSNSLLHISTDTFTYHLASLTDTPSIVLFTMTCPIKNYDINYHTYAEVCTLDPECRCQRGICWFEKTCNYTYPCNKIPIDMVFDKVLEKI
jgi:ADP-heptose:LPS heptosyltransferase